MHSKLPYQKIIDDPVCTYWHELYPKYCTDWHLTSWEDNGDDILSPNDQIDMTNEDTLEKKWYHVDRMTTTLNLSYPFPEPEPPAEPGKIIWFMQVPPQGPNPPTPPEEKIIWFVQITEPGGPETYIDEIRPCKWYRVIDTEPPQPGFTPPPCSWWHVFYPEQMYCIYFHVDANGQLPGEFHIDQVLPEWRQGPVIPPTDIAMAEWVPPLEPIDLIEPCKWYRVIDTEPYQPGFVPPPCSWWHVFYPESLYCIMFHVDKNTADGMFHIDEVQQGSVTVDPSVDVAEAEWTQQKRMFVELKDTEWDPASPVGTYWHEVAPNYSNVYLLYMWTDNGNGILDYCDDIVFQDAAGNLIKWHVDGVNNDLILREKIMDPICTWWHEIYPVYCPMWHISSWEDNGDGMLSPSDQIDMVNYVLTPADWDLFWSMGDVNRDGYIDDIDVDRIAAMFGWTGPPGSIPEDINSDGAVDMVDATICAKNYGLDIWTYFGVIKNWYHVDRVTIALLVSSMTGLSMKIELKTFEFEEMYNALKHPAYTLWHEVYPEYSNVYELYWDWWETDNCNGVLDVCDDIYLREISGDIWELWHVEDICYDIILNEKIADPVCTWWHELYPDYCNEYHIIGWKDNDDGLLSPCDTIDFETIGMRGYHVESVTLTADVTIIDFPEQHYYFELISSFEDMYQAKTQPIHTYWTMVWPEYWYGESIPIMDWIDNCNGVLDYCDTIDLGGTWCHVEGLSIDIIVTKEPTFYWKESYPEYAPSGMPDFDQNQFPQGIEGWCGPCAVANSLWWYDSQFHPSNLLTTYVGALSEHDPTNVPPFVSHLAYLMDTDGQRTVPGGGPPHSGTNVFDMEAGIAHYLSWTGVNPQGDVNGDGTVDDWDVWIVGNASGSVPGGLNWNMAADIYPVTTGWPVQNPADNIIDMFDVALVAANYGKNGTFYEHTVPGPDFYYIEEEVEKCQDVVLLLGFWIFDGEWYREKGHYVTVAGIDSDNQLIAICDPDNDAFENGLIPMGRIPVPHPGHPGVPTVHNNASLVSQDIYQVILDPCPGGNWSIVGYPGWEGWHVQIEYAVITSPLAVHDVAVTNVTVCCGATIVHEGQTVCINVTVKNEGDVTETFDTTAYYDTTPIQTIEFTLTPGETNSTCFSWNTTDLTEYLNYTISATAHLASDIDPSDNTYTYGDVLLVHTGDINGDCKVNVKDIFAIAKAFGSECGEPKYDPNCDVNCDGKINVKDIFATAKNFGYECPP
jgi:hypothetical protein